ncbi:hypothetical protein GCM10009804_59390 [Kribbella hippodromi]|uniref:Uncharacterized protein n=1 Tax=Kribbella hippodromi TaxID=434347 RepID=A0ABN2E363_9ACTN
MANGSYSGSAGWRSSAGVRACVGGGCFRNPGRRDREYGGQVGGRWECFSNPGRWVGEWGGGADAESDGGVYELAWAKSAGVGELESAGLQRGYLGCRRGADCCGDHWRWDVLPDAYASA